MCSETVTCGDLSFKFHLVPFVRRRLLEGLDDESVLELATSDGRVLITRNSRDFAPISRHWAEAGREHAGVILIWTLTPRQFPQVVDGVCGWLAEVPRPKDWHGLVVSI